jgi:hypothetical protein
LKLISNKYKEIFRIDEDNYFVFPLDESSLFHEFSTLVVEKNQELSSSSPQACWLMYDDDMLDEIFEPYLDPYDSQENLKQWPTYDFVCLTKKRLKMARPSREKADLGCSAYAWRTCGGSVEEKKEDLW